MTTSFEKYRAAELAVWNSFGANPTERYLTLPSGLNVRIQEVGDGPPALFVHGVMTAGTAFAPLAAHLHGLRCIVIDRPGCGLSDPWRLKSQFRRQAVDTLRDIVDVLALESIVVVGNSLGGIWSTWFALAHPQIVRRLALLGPSIGFPGVHVPAFMRLAAIPGFATLVRQKRHPSRETIQRLFMSLGHRKSLAAGKIPAEVFDWGRSTVTDTETQQNDFLAVSHAVGITGARPWIQLREEELRRLSVPTLLVTGTHDSHGGPQLAARIAKLIPNSTVEILQDAGHLPWLDDPAAVSRALLGFAK